VAGAEVLRVLRAPDAAAGASEYLSPGHPTILRRLLPTSASMASPTPTNETTVLFRIIRAWWRLGRLLCCLASLVFLALWITCKHAGLHEQAISFAMYAIFSFICLGLFSLIVLFSRPKQH
jgi:hypothetical protein